MYYKLLRRTSYSLHLFGKVTAGLKIGDGSVMEYIHKNTLLFHDKFGEEEFRFNGPKFIVVSDPHLQEFNSENIIFTSILSSRTILVKSVTITVQTGSLILPLHKFNIPSSTIKVDKYMSLAALNTLLRGVQYISPPEANTDKLLISVLQETGGRALFTSHIVIFNRLVTFLTHTHGRVNLVERMYKSIQDKYPLTKVLATNDVMNEKSNVNEKKSNITWITVPANNGLSASRNTLLENAKTEFVFIMDDDFILDEFASLDVLIVGLLKSKFDIAAPKIPADIENFNDFSGLIKVKGSSLILKPGVRGKRQGCAWVDFVPNVFMARRASLLRVKWDSKLKLGEHEEFFLRAQQSNLRILTCNHIYVKHLQDEWWLHITENSYNSNRARVYDYYPLVLRKHNLKRLVSFGRTVYELKR